MASKAIESFLEPGPTIKTKTRPTGSLGFFFRRMCSASFDACCFLSFFSFFPVCIGNVWRHWPRNSMTIGECWQQSPCTCKYASETAPVYTDGNVEHCAMFLLQLPAKLLLLAIDKKLDKPTTTEYWDFAEVIWRLGLLDFVEHNHSILLSYACCLFGLVNKLAYT